MRWRMPSQMAAVSGTPCTKTITARTLPARPDCLDDRRSRLGRSGARSSPASTCSSAPTWHPVAMVEHLVGMQAQEPRDPYLALWSRLDGFEPADLEAALLDRSLVRMVAMRGTIHLLTRRRRAGPASPVPAGARPGDGPPLPAQGRPRRGRPAHRSARSRGSCSSSRSPSPGSRAALAERFPEHDPAALAFACRNTVPLVQAPPRGLWTRSGRGHLRGRRALARPSSAPTVDDRRPARSATCAAFGPATVADFADVDPAHPPPRGVRPARPAAAHLDRRARSRAVRRRRRRDHRRRRAGARAVPARVRQRAAVPRRSEPDHRRAARRACTRPTPMGIGHVLVDGRVQATWRLGQGRSGDRRGVTVTHAGLSRKRPVSGRGRGAPRPARSSAHGGEAEAVVTRLS